MTECPSGDNTGRKQPLGTQGLSLLWKGGNLGGEGDFRAGHFQGKTQPTGMTDLTRESRCQIHFKIRSKIRDTRRLQKKKKKKKSFGFLFPFFFSLRLASFLFFFCSVGGSGDRFDWAARPVTLTDSLIHIHINSDHNHDHNHDHNQHHNP